MILFSKICLFGETTTAIDYKTIYSRIEKSIIHILVFQFNYFNYILVVKSNVYIPILGYILLIQ